MKLRRHVLWLGLLAACAPRAVLVPAAPRTEEQAAVEDDGLALRLTALGQALGEQGYTPSSFKDRGFLPANGRATRPIRVEANTCALFVAVATPSVIDLDASLYRADGTALVEDDGSDARPSLMLCAGKSPVSGYYAIHAYQGVGAFATAQFVRPAAAGDDLSTVELGDSPSPLAELAKTLHKRGFEDAAPRVQLNLSGARAVRMAVPAKRGDCYTLAAESGPKLAGVSLRLLNERGHELAYGVADSALASLQYCSQASEELSLEVSAREGSGDVRVARFRASYANLGGAHALWLGEPSPSPRAWEHAGKSEPQKQVSEKPALGTFSEERQLGQGSLVELESRAPLGPCETWRLALKPGLSKAKLRIESADDGTILGEVESDGMAAELALCDRRGAVRIIVTGQAGFGSVTLQGEKSAKPAAP